MPMPGQLKVADFAGYPVQGRKVAVENLALLRQLPLVFAAVLLREVVAYDWRFPAERRQIDGQMRVLGALSAGELAERMSGFRGLKVSAELERTDWVTNPAGFMEMLTAWLWSTQQMDGFRGTADVYARYLTVVMPASVPTMPRLGIVMVGQGVAQPQGALFRKLRPHGVYLSKVNPKGGVDLLLAAAVQRARGSEAEFGHWYIDGGEAGAASGLTQISYGGLDGPRNRLLDRTQRAIDSGSMGPEGLRTLLAQMKPEEIGLRGDAVLDRFQLALLTEGSGTQIFATTFVQWAARECLRRAQPETLVLRYAPRQEMQAMNAMLSGQKARGPDPQGSLVDAEMGAYYTWLNMTRLAGAEEMCFLVWFEGHGEAVAIGPGLPRGTTSNGLTDMGKVLELLG